MVVTEDGSEKLTDFPDEALSARCGEGRASLPGATAAVASLRPMTGAALDLPLLTRGKVREVYDLGDRLVLVATDRISRLRRRPADRHPRQGPSADGAVVFWFDLPGERPEPPRLADRGAPPRPRRGCAGACW